MDRDEKDKQGGKPIAGGGSTAKSRKAVYSKPVLHVYGSVSKLTRGVGGTVSDGTTMDKMAKSDRNAKQDIVRIGDHPLGIGLYLFEYKPAFRERWGHGRRFGVMADEVERVLPEAVSTGPDGYKVVDYGMLGIR